MDASPLATPKKLAHPSREERAARGKQTRLTTPLTELAAVAPAEGRADPISLLEQQAASRVPELVPIRYGRMSLSAFAFFRGAALVMANDLAATRRTGLDAQLCGDAHMSNFGVFASPERHLIFDANDFDETHPGPFEWDLKRLAASLEIAGRGNGYTAKQRRRIVLAAATGYREALRGFAKQSNLDVWYAHLDIDQAMAELGSQLLPAGRRRGAATLAKARTRDSLQAFAKLTTVVDGRTTIISDPPLIVPIEELLHDQDADELYAQIRLLIRSYRRTLQLDRRHLLEEFKLVQVARKVVGVGSVGSRAWILLMVGVDGADPMFLQAKEAQPSVLEAFTRSSAFKNQGQRVVAGQRLMQAASNIFRGWQRTNGIDGIDRDFYVRQLRDWKGSAEVEQMVPDGMAVYGRLCGWTLARAHARSGDRVAIAAYLGGKDTFDQAIADFAGSYADQNDRDYAALLAAIDSGRLKAVVGL